MAAAPVMPARQVDFYGTPWRGGLLDAARIVDLDAHWQAGGFSYASVNCTEAARATVDYCVDPDVDDKDFDADGLEFVQGTPFTLYASVTCRPIGSTFEELRKIAVHRLTLGEEAALASVYASGSAGNTPALVDDGCALIGDAVTPHSPASAIGLLEGAMARVYGTNGVLHAPREALPMMVKDQLAIPSGNSWKSPSGNTWSFSAYPYPGTAPAGTAAVATGFYVYATGAVTIARSEIFTSPPTINGSMAIGSNDLTILAERTYAITHECYCAAVLVSR